MNDWKLYSDTQDVWQRMLADIESAQVSIELEQYSLWDDTIGHKFLQVLQKKHQQGVRIRLICDGYGSYPLFQSAYVKDLIKSGMEIKAFNPFSPTRSSSWFYHLHKKTLVIDSKIGWLGGLGIKKKFFHFQDAMARMEGPVVLDIQEAFEVLWAHIKQKKYFKIGDFHRRSEDPQLLISYCGYDSKEIYEQLRLNIQNAEKSIYLTTSYFFPDRNFFQLILDKARAGVDVKIILRGKDDEFLPVRFSTSYFHKSLLGNIQIYRYEPAIIHAKTAVIDGKWATMGSSNLDKFSFYYNMEANLASTEPQFVEQVHELFAHHLKDCRKIELQDWKNRSMLDKFFEILIWPIHNYL